MVVKIPKIGFVSWGAEIFMPTRLEPIMGPPKTQPQLQPNALPRSVDADQARQRMHPVLSADDAHAYLAQRRVFSFRKFTRTIVGVDHRGGQYELEQHQAIVKRSYDLGARSIGLELSQSHFGNDGLTCPFKQLAEYAQKLGMEVIPLIEDKTWERGKHLIFAMCFLSDDGGFDKEGLNNTIEQIDSDMQRLRKELAYAAPEEKRQLQYIETMKQRHEALRDYFESTGYDVDEFAREWDKHVRLGQSADMERTIRRERPDLVIVGKMHCRDLRSMKRYRFMDALALSFVDSNASDVIDEDLISRMPSNFRSAFMAHRLMQLSAPLIAEVIGRQPYEHELRTVAMQAIEHAPNFHSLAMRAHGGQDVVFDPPHDADVFKMSVDEARMRTHEAIRHALA